MAVRSRIPHNVAEIVTALAFAVTAVLLSLWVLPLARFDTTEVTIGEGRAAVVARTTDLRHAGVVSLAWAVPQPLYSAAAGLVTAISVTQGGEVNCGATPFEVDARPVVLFCASRPISGVIPDSSTDLETAAFVDFIIGLGVQIPPGDIHDEELTQAIVEFQTMVGQEPDGSVEPSDLLWSPTPLRATHFLVHVGEPVSIGAVVMIGPARLISATLTTTREVSLSLGEWVVDLAALGLTALAIESGGLTDLGTIETAAGALYDDEDLPTGLDASIRLAEGLRVIAIPPSALVADGSAVCVLIDEPPDLRPVDVTIVGAEVDATYVVSDLVGGEMVVTAPDVSRTC